ncbi:hypothetical protein N7512_000816 [Penicillium capsulatum]|nr:hypothetical protein N7512_000816 [Penicillium capsulatum]
MSTFTDFLLYAMIVPVMPTALMERAGVPSEDREKWVSILLMCEAGTAFLLCPFFGYFVDRARTRRLPFLGALFILAGCMVALQTSHSLAMFIVGRLLQGCAGALVVVAAFSLLTDTVPREHLGQAIGYLGSAIASGIIAVDLMMRTTMIEKKVAASWMRLSDIEDETFLGSTGSRVMVSTQELQPGSRFALFRILSQRRVLISSWALLVHGILLSAFDATLSIFVESRYGWSAQGMGLIFLPMAVPAFFEPLFGYITDRFGARYFAFGCFSLLSPALICLRFTEINSATHIALLVVLLFLIGIFIHGCAPAMFVETQQALTALETRRPGLLGPKGAVAQGFGLQSMCQFAGVFFGPLWGGFVEYRFGWGAMSGTLGVLAALTAMPMLWLGEDNE